MSSALLVFSPQQQGDDVEDVKAALRTLGEVRFSQESNVQAGLALLRQGDRHDLIVVGSRLAQHREDAVAEGGGLDFCRQARPLATAPLLLLAPKVTTALRTECTRIAGAGLFPLDDKAELAEVAKTLLAQQQAPQLQLEITVFADDSGWRYTMRGVCFEFCTSGDLTVHRSTWMCWSGLYHSEDHWFLDFAKVGNSIRTCLCDENPHFRKDLELADARAAERGWQLGLDPRQARLERRVTFVVAKSYYPLVLEAISNPRAAEPWLADARLARRIQGSASERGDLFAPAAGPLRALLICADTRGLYYSKQMPGGKLDLSRLDKVHDECQRVEALLTVADPVTGTRLIDPRHVRRLGFASKQDADAGVQDADVPPVTMQTLRDALIDGPWDVIHYAGHSHFQAPANERDVGTGCLFVGPPGRPEAVEFSYVASFLRSARFVYLSSCESGNSSFAVEASAAGIHTVMGFRWKVADWAADLQARLFYRGLRRFRSVDSAFWAARRRIYRRYRQKQNIWASAILVTPE